MLELLLLFLSWIVCNPGPRTSVSAPANWNVNGILSSATDWLLRSIKARLTPLHFFFWYALLRCSVQVLCNYRCATKMETLKPPLWWHATAALIALPLLFIFSLSLSLFHSALIYLSRARARSPSHSRSSIHPPLWVNYGVCAEGRGCFVFCHLRGICLMWQRCATLSSNGALAMIAVLSVLRLSLFNDENWLCRVSWLAGRFPPSPGDVSAGLMAREKRREDHRASTEKAFQN